MSWSLQVSHGDLALGGHGLNTVSGSSKLVQDLGCAVLEPMGTDPMHPSFGSIIDGGTDARGNAHSGIIGEQNDRLAATFVGSEIQRICRTYQAQQIARNRADVAIYGKSTLTAEEALLSVDNIAIHQVADQMLVTATLQTGTGNSPLTLPITTS